MDIVWIAGVPLITLVYFATAYVVLTWLLDKLFVAEGVMKGLWFGLYMAIGCSSLIGFIGLVIFMIIKAGVLP